MFEKNLENITNEKKWIRPCSICGKNLQYQSQKSFRYAIKHKNKCKSCQDNSRKRQEKRICLTCKNEFNCHSNSKRKFCSPECHYTSGLQKYKRKVRYCKFCMMPIHFQKRNTILN
jgi:hypothetical protein